MANIKTDELDQWHDYGVYTPARLIDCMGSIDEEKAKEVIKNIRLLDFVSDKDITILLATEGGDVHWGMEIFDAIKECNSKVTIHAVGPCWSMGSVILQAGDFRLISPSATVMIHLGTSAYPENHVLTQKQWIEEHDRIEKETQEILYKKMKEKDLKFTKAKLQKLLTFDTIYTAEDTIKVGLADKIEDHKSF